jgi:cellulose synthase/poly-beta-1,6-N-acetylglucosamine synthase-like glycosyltransferase
MTMKASVITTVLNEVDSIDTFLTALEQQTIRPDEVVIVDAGSTDGTIEIIERHAGEHPWVRLIREPGNRSHGRNTAIAAAVNDYIACADAGCTPDASWLEELFQPFSDGADWVAGFYRVDAETPVDRCVGLTIVYVEEEVDADSFLPSARSMAFTRAAWNAAGRFPEEVEFGEDTLFGVRMREAGIEAHVALGAVVGWHPPTGFGGLAQTTFRWGRGDAVARVRGSYYKRTLGAVVASGVAIAVLAIIRPRLIVLGAVPLVSSLWRTTRHKYRHESHPSKWFLLPAARAIATLSNLAGYVAGRAFGE